MFEFWGDGSQAAMDLVNSINVRSTDNFNWTFIFILAVVFYVYWSEINKKNYDAVFVYMPVGLNTLHGIYKYGSTCCPRFQNKQTAVMIYPYDLSEGG